MKKIITAFITIAILGTTNAYAGGLNGILNNGKNIVVQALGIIFFIIGAWFALQSFLKRNILAAVIWLVAAIALAFLISNSGVLEGLIQGLLQQLGIA